MRLTLPNLFLIGLQCALPLPVSGQVAAETKPMKMPEKVAVFAVNQTGDQTSIAPITLVHYGSDQRFKVIPSYGDPLSVPVWTEQEFDAFEKTYFRQGNRLSIFSGGELIGGASVESSESEGREGGCHWLSASILYRGHGTPSLATNTTTEIPGHRSTRRAASDTEIATLRGLARQWLSEYGLSDTLLERGVVGAVVAARLRDGAGMALIGRYDVTSQRSVHRLFVVAERQGATYRLTLADLSLQRDIEFGKDRAEIQYLDQLDVNNGGQDEVVVREELYEGWSYTIYSPPQGGRGWGIAFTGGGGGC
jgi:hypothetical protein